MNKVILSENWLLQASDKLDVHGETISTPEYKPENWYAATVPGSVAAGLVGNGVYEDPYYGLNMKTMPGYKLGKTTHFSSHHMPDDSPFRQPWWYRTSFTLPAGLDDKRIWLLFKGVNFSANIWLNGKRIAGNDYAIGAFRGFELDATGFVSREGMNVLALEIFAPQPDDLGVTFIDWSPVPPDDCMGIWQPVVLSATGPVAIKHPFVESALDVDTLDRADLVISAELVNTADKPVSCSLEGVIEDVSFHQTVELKAFERATVRFSPDEHECLALQKPRVWWPYQMGDPELYGLNLRCVVDGTVSDTADVVFGIRDIRSRINEHGARQFTVNGRDILVRGAAWVPDLMLRQSESRDRNDLDMFKSMNLNTIRLEGKLGSDVFWDICDREGIMIIAGWPCCNHWERWAAWKPGDMVIAGESLRWQMQRLRNHPSLIAWLYGSDFPPPEPVEHMYLDVLKETHETLPSISNASAKPSVLQGPTGVKMSGPNKYVPPIYWYDDERPGRADSFNTETCPDACVPVYESLQKFLPDDQCYPGSPAWNHHAGLSSFSDTNDVNEAVAKRYGEPADTRDFTKKALSLGYECWRAMFEAYARNFPRGTGVIGWMLNSSWPSVFWQLYDYYFQPTGAFYGAQKACETPHIQYSYDDGSVWAVNMSLVRHDNLTASAAVKTPAGKTLHEQSVSLSLDAYERKSLFTVPDIKELPPVYFLFLSLKRGEMDVSRNVYWLATSRDIFTPKPRRKFYWSLKEHADMSSLRSLPNPDIEHAHTLMCDERGRSITVSLKNKSDFIAFFLWLKLYDKSKKDLVAPFCWSENGVTLQPGEERIVIGKIPESADTDNLEVIVDKW